MSGLDHDLSPHMKIQALDSPDWPLLAPIDRACRLVEADSLYVEHYWTPFVGPTGILLLRRLSLYVSSNVEATVTVPTRDLALSLGLGPSLASQGHLARALGRLVHHNLARVFHDEPAVLVRRYVPELTRAQIERLPSFLRSGALAARKVTSNG